MRRTHFGRMLGHTGSVPILGGWKGNFDPPFWNVKGCRASRIDVPSFPGSSPVRTTALFLTQDNSLSFREKKANKEKNNISDICLGNVNANLRSIIRFEHILFHIYIHTYLWIKQINIDERRQQNGNHA